MKKFISLSFLLVLLFASCNTKKNEDKTSSKSTPTEKKKNFVVQNFLKDFESLKHEKGNPIATFNKHASSIADKTINLNKESLKTILENGKKYKYIVITVEDHTIVRIVDTNNCKPSGKWGLCMPFAQGFIKKGKLQTQEDYANFIIGIPDKQKRTAYLFH